MNKIIYLLTLLSITSINQNLCSQNKTTGDNDTVKLLNVITPDKVEKKPLFKGKDASAFRDWLYQNMRLPDKRMSEGVASVSFVVDTTGIVREVSILKGITPSFDDALYRLVKSSPRWKPGKVNGEPVNVRFVMPFVVKFR